MSDRPIIFSGPLVLATLNGHATETRRPITRSTSTMGSGRWAHMDHACARPGRSPSGAHVLEVPPLPKHEAAYGCDTLNRIYPRWEVGDRLWARETFAIVDGPTWTGLPCAAGPDGQWACYREGCGRTAPRWRSPIHMPRWASRLTLEVVSVRVERVQDITGAGVLAEGVGQPWNGRGIEAAGGMTPKLERQLVGIYRRIWSESHGDKPGLSWADNPWAWVLGFKRVEVSRD